MKHYNIPICLLHHEGAEVSCTLDIEIPKYRFQQQFQISDVPQSIFQARDAVPTDELRFSVAAGRIPHWMDFRMQTSVPYVTLVLFRPRIDVDFGEHEFKDAPFKTMSQLLEGQEIAVDIPGQEPRFWCRSWANAHLKNGNHLKWRFLVDLQHAGTVQKQLNML